jgi:hypothetical protein
VQLSQSEWIAVAILAGFLIYLAIKGKLANYWSLLTGGAAAGTSASSTAASSSPAATAGAQVGAIAGAAAGPALPGVTSGTVTQGGQTTQQYFPNIPGVNLNNPMSMVTF